MKKMVLLATALAMVSGSAVAADMPVKAVRAPPPAAFDPWDIAFGSAIMNDYIFRGVTQSNHKPSVAAYFEPRYNVTKDVQLYVGLSGESVSFPNRAAAEIDIYGGIRPTFGMFAFDFGLWGYLYPGGRCFNAFAFPGSGIPGSEPGCLASPFGNSDPVTLGLPVNGNFAKRNMSFYEGYAKVNVTLNDQFQIGANEYYSPNIMNLGAWGNYASITGKWTAPSTTFGSSGVGMYVSGEFGRQWLGTSDRFYGTQIPGQIYQNGIPEPSYNTWNIGVGFTYKVFTLDLRYSDTNLSKGACNAFTSDYTASQFSPANVSLINPGGFGSNWCGAAGIVKLSADLTAMTNLK
ncbi:MAG TPA: TorF family putative porin [Bradyrhizobium sp.]